MLAIGCAEVKRTCYLGIVRFSEMCVYISGRIISKFDFATRGPAHGQLKGLATIDVDIPSRIANRDRIKPGHRRLRVSGVQTQTDRKVNLRLRSIRDEEVKGAMGKCWIIM